MSGGGARGACGSDGGGGAKGLTLPNADAPVAVVVVAPDAIDVAADAVIKPLLIAVCAGNMVGKPGAVVVGSCGRPPVMRLGKPSAADVVVEVLAVAGICAKGLTKPIAGGLSTATGVCIALCGAVLVVVVIAGS